MTVQLSPLAAQRFYDNANVPLNGGKLFTYIAGTTTKVATYTDSTGGTPNANPVILNARGEAGIWGTVGQGYKYVLAPANDTDPPTNPFWTVDNVSVPANAAAAAFNAKRITSAQALTASAINTAFFNVANFNQGNGFSAASGVFTAPVAGLYLFSASALLASSAGTMLINNVYFSRNANIVGTNLVWDMSIGLATSLAVNVAANAVGSIVVQLVAGDTMAVFIDLGAGGTPAMQLRSHFSGYLIG